MYYRHSICIIVTALVSLYLLSAVIATTACIIVLSYRKNKSKISPYNTINELNVTKTLHLYNAYLKSYDFLMISSKQSTEIKLHKMDTEVLYHIYLVLYLCNSPHATTFGIHTGPILWYYHTFQSKHSIDYCPYHQLSMKHHY